MLDKNKIKLIGKPTVIGKRINSIYLFILFIYLFKACTTREISYSYSTKLLQKIKF